MSGADDLDPDGYGEPGDMRYDYQATRMRRDFEARLREAFATARAAAKGEDPPGPAEVAR